jgi:hypothetical protein
VGRDRHSCLCIPVRYSAPNQASFTLRTLLDHTNACTLQARTCARPAVHPAAKACGRLGILLLPSTSFTRPASSWWRSTAPHVYKGREGRNIKVAIVLPLIGSRSCVRKWQQSCRSCYCSLFTSLPALTPGTGWHFGGLQTPGGRTIPSTCKSNGERERDLTLRN